MAKKTLNKVNEPPIFIKIIASLFYIGAAAWSLYPIFALLLKISLLNNYLLEDSGKLTNLGLIIILSLTLVLLSISWFIGKSLWNRKNWARKTVILFSILWIIQAITVIIVKQDYTAIIQLIISLVIGLYLLLNKNLKLYFNNS